MAQKQSYTKTTTQDGNHDGIPDSITTETFKYKNGLLVGQIYEQDWDGNGSIDYRSTTTNTYKNGDLVKSIVDDDWYGDGFIDNRQVTQYAYDKGNLVSTDYTSDYGADGNIEYHSLVTNKYNNKGLLVKTTNKYDWDGGGFDQTDVVKFEYDGRELARESYDFGNDGLVEQVIDYDTLIT